MEQVERVAFQQWQQVLQSAAYCMLEDIFEAVLLCNCYQPDAVT